MGEVADERRAVVVPLTPSPKAPAAGSGAGTSRGRDLAPPSGALWLAAERLLVVADLRLEKGSACAARGQLLPPYDTRETLARLTAEAAQQCRRRILLLGDSFHDLATRKTG